MEFLRDLRFGDSLFRGNALAVEIWRGWVALVIGVMGEAVQLLQLTVERKHIQVVVMISGRVSRFLRRRFGEEELRIGGRAMIQIEWGDL